MTAKAAQKISLWEFFQQLGKTFMLPVALLSFCGIMLGIKRIHQGLQHVVAVWLGLVGLPSELSSFLLTPAWWHW